MPCLHPTSDVAYAYFYCSKAHGVQVARLPEPEERTKNFCGDNEHTTGDVTLYPPNQCLYVGTIIINSRVCAAMTDIFRDVCWDAGLNW